MNWDLSWLRVCAEGEVAPACIPIDQAILIAIGGAFLLLVVAIAFRSRDFSTATLALIPAAIAINVAAGSIVYALKLPIYLDSIGTVLVAVLAGPWAGAATGIFANMLWSLLPIPGGAGPTSAAFAPVAGVIGLMAGLWARAGILRVRAIDERTTRNVALATFAWGWLFLGGLLRLLFAPNGYFSHFDGSDPDFFPGVDLTALALADHAGLYITWAFAGLVGALFGTWIYSRRLAALLPVWIGGLTTGIVAAIISAPIAAFVYGGVTGAGTDLLVVLYRAAGLNVFASAFAQGVTSDPLDKTLSYTVVFAILSALPLTVKTLFPRGDQVIAPDARG